MTYGEEPQPVAALESWKKMSTIARDEWYLNVGGRFAA